jgi:hypothetical protein
VKLHSWLKILVASVVLATLAGAAFAGFSAASGTAVSRQSTHLLTVDPRSSFVRNAVDVAFDSKQKYNVAPGDSVSGTAYCPKDVKTNSSLKTWYVVGGGYVIGGDVGESIASATASYPTTASNAYRVVVSNPKAASGDVNFLVRASCLEVIEGPLGS